MGYIKCSVIRINLKVFCAMEVKSNGRLILTGTNIPLGCSIVMFYNVVWIRRCKS